MASARPSTPCHAEARNGAGRTINRRADGRDGPYVLQAAIAACHALAPSWEETDWAAIESWYDVLRRIDDGPVVRLNAAVAVAEARGPAEGLALVDANMSDQSWGDEITRGFALKGEERAAMIFKYAYRWAGRHSERKANRLLANAHRLTRKTTLVEDLAASRPVTDEELATIRAHPTWPARIAAVHTSIRELCAGVPFDPEQADRIRVPVLMLVGGDTTEALRHAPETVAAALFDARIAVLDGQQHIAHRLAPEVFARHVLAFLHDEP